MKNFYTLITFPFRSVMPLSLFGIDDLAIAAIIGTVVSAGVNAYNNHKANSTNIANQNKVNAQNLAFQEKQFAEQSYLNRNQYQITASDMQKAGLNPLTMNGANLTSGNFNSTAQAGAVNPYQIDTSALSNIATTAMQGKTQKQINKDTLQTQKDIAKDKNDTDLKIAQLQQETQTRIANQRITEDARQFQLKLSQDLSIANIQAELQRRGIESKESIAKAERILKQQFEKYEKQNLTSRYESQWRLFFQLENEHF